MAKLIGHYYCDQMPERTKDSEFEVVKITINNRTYSKIMRKEEADIYKFNASIRDSIMPAIKKSFDSLVEKLSLVFERLNVPKVLSERLLDNERHLYSDFIKPETENRLWTICKKNVNTKGIAEARAKELSLRVSKCIEDKKSALESSTDFKESVSATLLLYANE